MQMRLAKRKPLGKVSQKWGSQAWTHTEQAKCMLQLPLLAQDTAQDTPFRPTLRTTLNPSLILYFSL